MANKFTNDVEVGGGYGGTGITLDATSGDGSFDGDVIIDGTITVGGGGVGDVVGPASSTDNALARFNSTTGKLIQDSPNSIADDDGNVSLGGTAIAAWDSSFRAVQIGGTGAIISDVSADAGDI